MAALAVAFHHIGGSAFFLTAPLHGNLAFGVDFFFLLSGFVIAASYGERLAGGFPLLRYAVLRWGRVWPLHAAMVLTYLALELLLSVRGGMSGRQPFTGPRDPATLPVVLLLLQAWIMPGRDLWNVQSWTISVEIGLYLGAALLWRGFGKLADAIGLAMALIALAWLSGSPGLAEPVLRGIAGFGLGMACWAIKPRVERFRLSSASCSALELGSLALVAWLLAGTPSYAALDLAFAAMVLVFAGEQGVVSRLFLTAPMRWLGTLSYGLYMVHGLVIGRIFDLLAFVQARGWGRRGSRPILAVATCCYSRPFRRWRHAYSCWALRSPQPGWPGDSWSGQPGNGRAGWPSGFPPLAGTPRISHVSIRLHFCRLRCIRAA